MRAGVFVGEEFVAQAFGPFEQGVDHGSPVPSRTGGDGRQVGQLVHTYLLAEPGQPLPRHLPGPHEEDTLLLERP